MYELKTRLFGALFVLVFLTGCIHASTREIRSTAAEENSWLDREETIYIWYTDEKMTDYISKAAVDFGERESVRVIPHLAAQETFLNDLYDTSIHQGDQMPDLCLIGHETLEKAYLLGLATEIHDDAQVCTSANFSDAALSSVTYKGKMVAYPLSFNTSALVYNKNYLALWAQQQALKELSGTLDDNPDGGEDSAPVDAEAVEAATFTEEQLADLTAVYYADAVPETLTQLLQLAATFDAPSQVTGVMSWDVSNILYNYWLVGQAMTVGGDAGDDRNNISVYNDEAVSCLTEYQKLNAFFSMDTKTTYEDAVRDFMEGKLIFTVGTTDIVATLDKAREEGTLEFEYGISEIPDINDEHESRSLSVTTVVAVSGYSLHSDLANRFAEYLVTESATDLHAMAGVPAANLGANENSPAEMAAFETEYAVSVPLPKMMETENFWMQLEAMFARIWDGADVSESLENLEKSLMISLGSE